MIVIILYLGNFGDKLIVKTNNNNSKSILEIAMKHKNV